LRWVSRISESYPMIVAVVHDNRSGFFDYLMYWSDADVLDVCYDPDPPKAVEHLRNWKNAYLVTNRPLPVEPLVNSPIGEIYSLNGLPFDVWGPAASGACSLPPRVSRYATSAW